MQSFSLVSLVSLLLLGCVSSSHDGAGLAEQEGAQAIASSAQNEPCPAPAQPLITPDTQSAGGKIESEVSPMTENPEALVAETPETLAPQAEPGDSAAEPALTPSETPISSGAEGRPDVQSRMDVDAVPPEIPDQRDYFVTARGLNVRSAPSGQSSVTRQLRLGEKVKSFGREGIWIQIGEQEYVSIVYLSERPVAVQADNQPE